MISEKTAFWFTTAGWIAALFTGVLTAVIAWRGVANLHRINLIDAGILLVLAYGIFRKSRICAILALAYYVVNQVARLRMPHESIQAGGLVFGIALFVTLYSLGVVGTFAFHRGTGSNLTRS